MCPVSCEQIHHAHAAVFSHATEVTPLRITRTQGKIKRRYCAQTEPSLASNLFVTLPGGYVTGTTGEGGVCSQRENLCFHKPTVSLLMILLVYCHINSFQRASSMKKPFPGGENRRDGLAAHHKESEAIESLLLPYAATGMSLLAVGGRSGATASGAAVDVCSDAPAWVQWVERAADGGVVDVSRALSRSPSALRINAQHVARSDSYNVRNCLPPK
jgi:hypothetical protein